MTAATEEVVLGQVLATIRNEGIEYIAVSMTDVRESIYQAVFVPLASPSNASLLYASAYTLLMLTFAWALYARR